MIVRGQQATISNLKSEISNLKSPIWFHAASVGEFEQARPLIERLRREQPQRKIVITFFSPSGYEARKNYAQVDGVYYLPFAMRRNAKRFISALQPFMAVFVKYEFWPAYIRELKKRGIPTYSISAIFRPNQYFFRWWGKAQLRVLKCFTHIYVQDEASHALLAKHGIAQVSVAGDTRFDRVRDVMTANQQASGSTLQARLTPVAQFVEGCERVIVAGSTWPKDEVLLKQYLHNWADNGTKLILVPHEIDDKHLHFIFNLFKGRFVRYTSIARHQSLIAGQPSPSVLVIDTMGLLSSIYRFGQVAYIGGGFGVGIHNTIEAAVYGVPVLFGPNYHHFREAEGLIDANAARSIKNYNELEAALNAALDNHAEIGARATAYVSSETGASEKIYQEIF